MGGNVGIIFIRNFLVSFVKDKKWNILLRSDMIESVGKCRKKIGLSVKTMERLEIKHLSGYTFGSEHRPADKIVFRIIYFKILIRIIWLDIGIAATIHRAECPSVSKCLLFDQTAILIVPYSLAVQKACHNIPLVIRTVAAIIHTQILTGSPADSRHVQKNITLPAQMLTAQVTGTSNSIVRERYLTVSVVKRNADEARSYFSRVGTDLVTHLAQLSSVANELTLTERLHIFRDFFKAGEQAAAEFNIHEHAKRGQHFKDWFCPDSMEFAADHFKLDARYGRVLYLQDYASYIKDSFVSELCDLDRDLMLSIDILPVPTDEAARQLQSLLFVMK